jgi:hypothetical protein
MPGSRAVVHAVVGGAMDCPYESVAGFKVRALRAGLCEGQSHDMLGTAVNVWLLSSRGCAVCVNAVLAVGRMPQGNPEFM